jgi:hypothetical protein
VRVITALLAAVAVLSAGPAASAAGDEDVLAFGAPELGSTGSVPSLNAPVVGLAVHPAGGGYWEVASDGGVFAFGRAAFVGWPEGRRPSSPVVGLAADPDGRGYWLAAADGSVFPFDAPNLSPASTKGLNAAVVGIAPFPGGGGYWLAAADGGVFAFGNAPFLGSAGGLRLNAPVVGMTSTIDGRGYWLVTADGGVFAFGNAPFLGSAGGLRLGAPVVGMAADPDGRGYWLAAADGGLFAYEARYRGNGAEGLGGRAVAGIAADRGSGGYWLVLRRPPRPASLRAGDGGFGVLALERRLVALGYWLGTPDEVFDSMTSHAVVALQKVAGLPRDGVVAGTTWQALDRGARPTAASTVGRVMEIDLTRQVLMAVNDGKVEWTFDTSTGRRGLDTPSGRFSVDSEIDTPDHRGQYRPKQFYGRRDISIHGFSSVPTEPFSHGCARVVTAAMDFIWSGGLAPVGTPVWVS